MNFATTKLKGNKHFAITNKPVKSTFAHNKSQKKKPLILSGFFLKINRQRPFSLNQKPTTLSATPHKKPNG